MPKTTDKNAIDLEVHRLKKLPQSGVFTLLHHRGPLLEPSVDLMERVNFILLNKPKQERLVRLRHIRFVLQELLPENCQKAYADCDKADADWRKADAYCQKAYADKAYADCDKADADWRKADAYCQKAYADCQKALSEFPGALALVKKLVPHCKWSGKCIAGTDGTA